MQKVWMASLGFMAIQLPDEFPESQSNEQSNGLNSCSVHSAAAAHVCNLELLKGSLKLLRFNIVISVRCISE